MGALFPRPVFAMERTHMSRVAIIGGHGKVALHLAKDLTARGHQVTSLFRNPDHAADVEATGATAVVADV